jgi:ubiquinone/menaquinone biosynthesis C-methylase UbiE
MGYIFDFNTAKAYEKWCDQPNCRMSFDRETRLMLELLNPVRGRRILDIGCGHGIGLKALHDAGLEVTGLDPSPYMLDIARMRLEHRADLHRGVAEDLPFDDNAFHYACIVKTLEFVDMPEKALEEVFRVTRERVFIGLVNRRALSTESHSAKGLKAPFCTHAHFLGLRKLKKMIRDLAGDVPIAFQTLWCPPIPPRKIADKLMLVPLVQQMPISMYTGIVVTLNPQYRTRPLGLRIPAKQGPRAIVG